MEHRGPVVTDADVGRFEQRLGVALPDDYRRFLVEVNGGRTAASHCVFRMRRVRTGRDDNTILNHLFSLNAEEEQDDLASAQQPSNPQVKLPDGLLEIGYDDFGSRLVVVLAGPQRGEVWMFDEVDPRANGSNPRVEWFDRRDVWKLADSFAEFVAGLRPLDSEPTASNSTDSSSAR